MKTALLHYSAAPIVGGVENVMHAHAEQFATSGLQLSIIAGRGDKKAMPPGVDFFRIDEIDSMNPAISAAAEELDNGIIPNSFEMLVDVLVRRLTPVLSDIDHLIIHNVMTKHFNLPLTAALFRLMDAGLIKHPIIWTHDLTWSSPNSYTKVYPSYPWNLLKTFRADATYVTISEKRRTEIVKIFECKPEDVQIIYNGVDQTALLGLSPESERLISLLDLNSADLILLMPVRVTKAKNFEYAIELVAELKKLGCHPKLIITGPPDPHAVSSMEYYKQLLRIRAQMDVEKEVRFIFESGPTPGEDYYIGLKIVSDLYRIADVLLMTSHREGFGMPILEAGLAGLPIISTPIPAVDELVEKNALIFLLTTPPSQLAKQILSWIQSNPEYKLRVRIRQNFTWKAIFQIRILPLLKMKN